MTNTKITNVSKKEDEKLDRSVKKESLKHLMVRTDLKGGAAKLGVLAICSSCHGC
jgi:hypothetical protein